MATRKKIRRTPEERDALYNKVVAMYLDGALLSEIQRETSVPRATVYMILEKAGIEPNRQGLEKPDPDTLVAEIRRLQEANQTLRDELTEAHKQLVMLRYTADFLHRLKVPPPAGIKSWRIGTHDGVSRRVS